MSGIVFLGTPDAAIPTLDIIHASGDLALVVTMPDRPRGRSRTPQPPPVKVRAVELGVPVSQPESRGELDEAIREAGDVDLGVVVAYGRIISETAFGSPDRGMVNVHFSLLPRWRGAAPVERAILAGDTVTGVSLMEISAGLDAGSVFDQWVTGIGESETAGELTSRLARAGAELLDSRLGELRAGAIASHPQPETGTTYASRIEADEARLDLTLHNDALLAAIRAFNPRPGAFADLGGDRFKVWRAAADAAVLEPGELRVVGEQLLVGTGSGALVLIEVQAAGAKRMPGLVWARGRQGDPGRLS
ncbi:MAG: methionyl-tRNA formyltransferase [Acidimicrobiia bacterium]|nr:methionyl-tRNA formyltransferase [Acidimicrobiia bacterium]